jgi:DNA modification methylase
MIINGNALNIPLADKSVQMVCTSPPYFNLRNYGTGTWQGGDAQCDHMKTVKVSLKSGLRNDGRKHKGLYEGEKELTSKNMPYKTTCEKCGAVRADSQIGLEENPDCLGWATGSRCGVCYVCHTVQWAREVKRVLRDDGTFWLNLGSSYVSSTLSQSQFLSVSRGLAYGNGGTKQLDCRLIDYVCSCLCDEHSVDFLNHLHHNSGTFQSTKPIRERRSQTNHDNVHRDYAKESLDALPPCALASTTIEFLKQLPGGCSRCDNRASSLSSLRLSFGDSHLSVDTSPIPLSDVCDCKSDNALPCALQLHHNLHTSRLLQVCYSCNILHDNVQPYYTTLKPKDDAGIPWRVALALQADGWWLRQDLIWFKRNPMPEPVTDRFTKAHEYIFLLSKKSRYYFDHIAVQELAAYPKDKRRPLGSKGAWELDGRAQGENGGGKAYEHDTSTRNRRSVWDITPQAFSGEHYATFPEKIPEICILAGTSEKGACSKCGAPWERVVERTNESTWQKRKLLGGATGGSMDKGNVQQVGILRTGDLASLPSKEVITTGWEPTCKCDAGVVPCIVLDPFSGSGTTGRVAIANNRKYVGIDLSLDYIQKFTENRLTVQPRII